MVGLAQFAQPTLLLLESLLLVLRFVEQLRFPQLDVLPVATVRKQQGLRHLFAQFWRQYLSILIIKYDLSIVLDKLGPLDPDSRVHLLAISLRDMLKILILLLPAFLLIVGVHKLAKLEPALVVESADVSLHVVLGGDLVAAEELIDRIEDVACSLRVKYVPAEEVAREDAARQTAH